MIPIYTGWANHSGEKERKGKKIQFVIWIGSSIPIVVDDIVDIEWFHINHLQIKRRLDDFIISRIIQCQLIRMILFSYTFFFESFFFSFLFFAFHFSSSRVTCWKLMLNWRVLGQSVESIPWWIYERHRMCRHTTFKNLSIRVFKMHEIDDEIDGKHIRNQKIQFTCSSANAGAYDRAYRERLCYS